MAGGGSVNNTKCHTMANRITSKGGYDDITNRPKRYIGHSAKTAKTVAILPFCQLKNVQQQTAATILSGTLSWRGSTIAITRTITHPITHTHALTQMHGVFYHC